MSWTTTYRPKAVAQLHLTRIREQLQTMLKAGKISQALLFAGPKGTGKTSTARIIGALLNDPQNAAAVQSVYLEGKKPEKPLIEPDSSSDFAQRVFAGESFVVQELDAASNRGIDDVRQLKSRIYLPPQEGLISVFILDEAHMLTTEAFNALLKILEEPPAHAVFIFATTELHKVPDTIVSRCQVLQFQKATHPEIALALKHIMKTEAITFEEAALEKIAQQADGSFRDAVKVAEYIAQGGAVTVESATNYLQLASRANPAKLIGHVLAKDPAAVVAFFQSARSEGVDPAYLFKQVLQYLHTALTQLIQGVQQKDSALTQPAAQFLLSQLIAPEVSLNSPIDHLPLELKLLEIIEKAKQKNTPPPAVPPKKNTSSENKAAKTPPPSKPLQSQAVEQSATLASSHSTGDVSNLITQWPEFLELLAQSNPTLTSILKSATIAQKDEQTITITVFYSFHQEQLLQARSLALLDATAKLLLGFAPKFVCSVASPQAPEFYSTEDLATAAAKALV